MPCLHLPLINVHPEEVSGYIIFTVVVRVPLTLSETGDKYMLGGMSAQLPDNFRGL